MRIKLLTLFCLICTQISSAAQTQTTVTLPNLVAEPATVIDVPIQVSTSSSVGIAQFVVEYNSGVIEFIDARIGADVSGISISNINKYLPFTPTSPGADKNVLVQLSGGGANSFAGTDREVVILQFEVTGSEGDSSTLFFDTGINKTYLSTIDLEDLAGEEISFVNGSFRIPLVSAYVLIVNIEPRGSGVVTVEPEKKIYHDGDKIVLDAIPHPGFKFDHWCGSNSSVESRIVFRMDSDKIMTAKFDASP